MTVMAVYPGCLVLGIGPLWLPFLHHHQFFLVLTTDGGNRSALFAVYECCSRAHAINKTGPRVILLVRLLLLHVGLVYHNPVMNNMALVFLPPFIHDL